MDSLASVNTLPAIPVPARRAPAAARADHLEAGDDKRVTGRAVDAAQAGQSAGLMLDRKYGVRHANRWVQARIVAIESRPDIHTLSATAAQELAVNDIGHVQFELGQPLPLEPYADNRIAGALIVVDPASNRTSGALLVHTAP